MRGTGRGDKNTAGTGRAAAGVSILAKNRAEAVYRADCYSTARD